VEVTVDKFGRILLPKRLRDLLGLRPGSRLAVTADEEQVVLRTVEGAPILSEDDGILVFEGEIEGEDGDLLKTIRDERLDRFGG